MNTINAQAYHIRLACIEDYSKKRRAMQKLRTLTAYAVLILVFLLTACGGSTGSGGGGGNVTVVNQGTVACTVSTLNTTANGPVARFDRSQEAVYRLQDANACRIAMLPKTDGRNLGMGELVAQLTRGQYEGTPEPARTVVLYTTPIFWGSKTQGHSEALADNDILKFVASGGVDRSRVTKLWLIIVTQFNTCSSCPKHVWATSIRIASKLGILVVPGLWQVTRYINASNPSTWVAPQSPKDITRIPLP